MHGRRITFLILFASLLLTVFCSSAITGPTGLPGEPASIMFNPEQAAENTYNIVTQPTDQWGLFVTTTPLPADYGQTTITPITKYDVQIQQNLQALEMTAIILATVATDTEGAAPELLSAEDSLQIGYHATAPANVDSILANGLYDSAGGRLGGAGVYVNNTPEGAIAEYMSVPGRPAPTVLQVQYSPGLNYTITPPPAGYTAGPLPFAADTLTTESIRLPGTLNTIIRNGSATVVP